MSKHWTNDELIDRLYEVSTGDEAHLEACGECQQRWERLVARRQGMLTEPVVATELLVRQRRDIYERIESPVRGFWHARLAPAMAALSMVALGFMLSGTDPAPAPAELAVQDNSQFFTEMYSMVASEPDALAPIRSLFEEQ